MANAKGSTNVRNTIQTGKNSVLPPRIPFPNVNQPYADYGLNSAMGSKVISKPRDGNIYHHRTPSESLIEEQPCWLDELLNEPESPLRKGHRRSSSDSFAYTDASSASSLDYAPMAYDENKFKPVISSLWGSQNFDHTRDDHQGHVYATPYCYGKPKNRAWELPLNSVTHPNSLSQSRDNGISQSARSSAALKEAEPVPSTAAIKEQTHDPKTSSEKKDTSHAKTSPENDTKRAKQKFAQRSRVRKLQYIAELEKNVQALQAEGSEFSAEVEFLNQQNLILSMENKALKQRLESLAQEKLIKYLEHEVLEREIGRLRGLYQQQQQQQQQHQQQQARQGQSSTGHRRGNSKDLGSQFALLNLNHKEADSGAEPVTGSLPM